MFVIAVVSQITDNDQARSPSGYEGDRVLGGGIVAGSLVA